MPERDCVIPKDAGEIRVFAQSQATIYALTVSGRLFVWRAPGWSEVARPLDENGHPVVLANIFSTTPLLALDTNYSPWKWIRDVVGGSFEDPSLWGKVL